ncbi:MAG: D-aminoacyl-tRNA deacylase [Nanoarchaeota archaeon]
MFKKYLVLASKKDKAGMNIITHLLQFKKNPLVNAMADIGFDIGLVEEEIIQTENLDMQKIIKYDFIIFASKHQSEKSKKTLSVHAPGNWRSSQYGGEARKACSSSALFSKFIFQKLNETAKKFSLSEYDITMEATHHGPLINKPCLFIEIGSTESEWSDKRAAFVIAKTISEAVSSFKEDSYKEIAVAIGGPHYCPNFNKIQLSSNIAISHVIANYSAPITEEIIQEAISKTFEEVDFAVLDWKGLGQAEQRDELIKVLDSNYIAWKKTSDIVKED